MRGVVRGGMGVTRCYNKKRNWVEQADMGWARLNWDGTW